MSMPTGEPGLILRCVECGELYVGSPTNGGDLIPDSAAAGGRCHECGGEGFEQITLAPLD